MPQQKTATIAKIDKTRDFMNSLGFSCCLFARSRYSGFRGMASEIVAATMRLSAIAEQRSRVVAGRDSTSLF